MAKLRMASAAPAITAGLFFSLLASLAAPALRAAESWPRLRGPNGSGLAEAVELPVTWDERAIRWRAELPGVGHGSPVVWGGKVFVLCADAETFERRPVCLDAGDGSVLWSKTYPTSKFKGHRFNSAASTTPAVDAERVYFTWGTAEELTMAAFTHEGEEVWKVNLGPIKGGHGFAASPIVHGDLVVLNNDQEKQAGNLLAVDRKTGELAWTVERKSQRISYSVPCVYEADGREVLVFTNWQHGFTAIDPADGSVIAEKSVFDTSTNERAISSPIVAGDLVIGTCGFTNNPKHCVAMKLEGDAWTEVWRIERSVPHIPSVIAVGERVFLWDDAGIVTCVDRATGDEIWRGRVPGVEGQVFGSPVSDGKAIFCADQEGNVHAIAVADELQPLGKNALGDLCRSTPAIVDGVIYVRTYGGLVAVGGAR